MKPNPPPPDWTREERTGPSAAAKLLRWKADELNSTNKATPGFISDDAAGWTAELCHHVADLLDRSLETETKLKRRDWLLFALAVALGALLAQQVLA